MRKSLLTKEKSGCVFGESNKTAFALTVFMGNIIIIRISHPYAVVRNSFSRARRFPLLMFLSNSIALITPIAMFTKRQVDMFMSHPIPVLKGCQSSANGSNSAFFSI